MRRIKISNAVNKTGDTGDDYIVELYKEDVYNPLKLNQDIAYKIKIGNEIGYLKTVNGTINDDKNGLILSAKDLSDFPDGVYYVEVWFDKDGLNYIYPSNGKARIKLDANIETIKGNMVSSITVEQLKQEIANEATTIKGVKGDPGERGPQGEQGVAGKDGLSAYQIWLNTGNTGTEQDFLNSLKGPKGDAGLQGPAGKNGTDGVQGADGAPGKSAYQIWLDAGNTGSEQDFLASLKSDAVSVEIPSYDVATPSGDSETVPAETFKEEDGKITIPSDSYLIQILQAGYSAFANTNGMDLTKIPTLEYEINTIKYRLATEFAPINLSQAIMQYLPYEQKITDLKAQVVELQKQLNDLKNK